MWAHMHVRSLYAHTSHTHARIRERRSVRVFVEVSEGAVSVCFANQANECHKARQRQEGSRVQHRGNPPRTESPPLGITPPHPRPTHNISAIKHWRMPGLIKVTGPRWSPMNSVTLLYGSCPIGLPLHGPHSALMHSVHWSSPHQKNINICSA